MEGTFLIPSRDAEAGFAATEEEERDEGGASTLGELAAAAVSQNDAAYTLKIGS